jgi:hypothetical protein
MPPLLAQRRRRQRRDRIHNNRSRSVIIGTPQCAQRVAVGFGVVLDPSK